MFLSKLSGEKAVLRPFDPSDIEALENWSADADVQKYMPESAPDEPVLDMRDYFRECEAARDEIHAAIMDKDSGELIGTIALTDINTHHGIAELGIVLGNKNYWGKGYGSEAVRMLLGEARGTYKLRRISAEVESGNEAMQKVLEHNGFELEGVSKSARIKKGQPIDTYRYFKLL